MGRDEEIRIRSIAAPEDVHAHVALQNLVWGHGPSEDVPAHLLIATARNGGVVLGAYAGATLVGCLFGIPALHNGRLCHLSHLLAVHPEWRGRGIGAALKWRQREIVLAQGITTVTWTFHPLGASNAWLNLTRLGGVVREYVREYYGVMDDALNRGIPSDRFVLEWQLDAPAVRDRAEGRIPTYPDDVPIVLGSEQGVDGLPYPHAFTRPTTPSALVEIPADSAGIRRRNPALDLSWRMLAREAFETLFALGYAATGVVRREERVFYYVERIEP